MKDLGIGICIIGSIIAILFIPCQFLGINVGWNFILGDSLGGPEMKNYQFINTGYLLLELILINGIGIALIYFGKSKK